MFSNAVVDALNTKLLEINQRRRVADRVVVYGKYGGSSSNPQFSDDLALIHLSMPFPSRAVQPAILGRPSDVKLATTIGGYGFSNADGGTFGSFNITWPLPVKPSGGQFEFDPKDDVNGSAFCQGDLGGPAFAGRARGCKAYDVEPEDRPRILQGVISFNVLGTPDPGGSLNQQVSSMCVHASAMVMQDITVSERRSWICGVTRNAAGGCK